MKQKRSIPAFFVGGPINGRTRMVGPDKFVWEVFRFREITPLPGASRPMQQVSDIYVRDQEATGPDGKILFRHLARKAIAA